MNFLLFIFLSVLLTVLVYIYCNYEGVLEPIFAFLPYKKDVLDDKKPFSKKMCLLVFAFVAVVAFLAQISLYKNTNTVGFIKLFVLLAIVICAGIIDFKRKIIPNLLVLFGLVFWVGITVFEITNSDNFKDIIISEIIGFAIGFGLLAIASIITKGSIGFGDAKLFGVIGLISGAFCTYSTLLVSLIISVIVSVVGIIRKKVGRKDSIPFGPCISLGYLIVLFLASY